MKHTFSIHIFLTAFVLFVGHSFLLAQNQNDYIKGHFSGSFESINQYYLKDNKIGALVPPDKYGSNSFLKLDYNYGKFSTGIQFESYLPPLLGYFPVPVDNQNKVINKYFKYTDDKFSVQVGDFYEQFGSGLIFRAFENRQIGINNALEGFNIHADVTRFLKLKAVYGRTRKILEYANSVTRGLDAEISINKLLFVTNRENIPDMTIGGSYVSRYQAYTGPSDLFPATVGAFSGRVDITGKNFSINSEYVEKGSDPHGINQYKEAKGKAVLINATFTQKNFGATFTARSLYNMDFMAEREVEFTSIAPVNYLPALTKQHDYLTSNIYVYNTQVKGEAGFQTDLFYQCKPGSTLGGKYGTKISINYALYNSIGDSINMLSVGDKKYFRDANVEIKKKWNKQFETTLGIQQIYYNTSVIQSVSGSDVNAFVIAAAGIYKFKHQKSVRVRLEHLSSKTDNKNWVSGLTEIALGSPFAIYMSDLYNYGKTNNHYYNIGASVTKKGTRFSLGYGKQRAGLFCVGGICRFVPAYYGFTATLTTSFAN